jgi:hypothetical protein
VNDNLHEESKTLRNQNICPYHVSHSDRLARNENDIQSIFSIIGRSNEKIDELEIQINSRIDGLKNMIIGGLATSILQLTIMIVMIIIGYFQLVAK